MEIEVIPHTDKTSWINRLQYANHTIYHTWEYCSNIADSYGLLIYLIAAIEGDDSMVCTFSERTNKSGACDAFSPYGYGGVFLSSGADTATDFIPALNSVARERKFTTGYFLQHPSSALPTPWQTLCTMHHQSFQLNLEPDALALWKGLSKGHRYEINKVRKEEDIKLITDKERLIPALIELHALTAKRVGASSTYDFLDSTLSSLSRLPESQLVGAEKSGKIKAVTLMLSYGYSAEFFISASTDVGKNYTRLLVWESMLILKQHGIKKLNLGGGVAPNDSLAKFKRRFGAEELPIIDLKIIFNREQFDELCNEHDSLYDGSGYFPPYWK